MSKYARLLQVIAEFTGMNIITSDSVNGTLTLRLKDVPWDQALDLILAQKNLEKRQVGNVVRIAPREELLAIERQAAESQKQRVTMPNPSLRKPSRSNTVPQKKSAMHSRIWQVFTARARQHRARQQQ